MTGTKIKYNVPATIDDIANALPALGEEDLKAVIEQINAKRNADGAYLPLPSSILFVTQDGENVVYEATKVYRVIEDRITRKEKVLYQNQDAPPHINIMKTRDFRRMLEAQVFYLTHEEIHSSINNKPRNLRVHGPHSSDHYINILRQLKLMMEKAASGTQ